jgi:hypothetical protein
MSDHAVISKSKSSFTIKEKAKPQFEDNQKKALNGNSGCVLQNWPNR